MNAQQKPVADIDLSSLSAQQRRALRLVKKQTLYRRPGGFGRAPQSVSLDVASSLITRGLVRQDYAGRQPALVLTGLGSNVLAVLDQRAENARRPH